MVPHRSIPLLDSLGYLVDSAIPQVGDPFGHLAH